MVWDIDIHEGHGHERTRDMGEKMYSCIVVCSKRENDILMAMDES